MVGTQSTPKKGCVVAMLNISKAFVSCLWIFGIIHSHDMDNHLVDYLCFSIGLLVEGSQFG
jgi:hypothetical protein